MTRLMAAVTALGVLALSLWHWLAGLIGIIVVISFAALCRAVRRERAEREWQARISDECGGLDSGLDVVDRIIAAEREQIERMAEEEKTL